MTELAPCYALLGLCARAQGHSGQYRQLRQAVQALPSWESLPYLAEAHGLSPLLFKHLKAAEIPIPAHIHRELQTRAIQYRHANGVRRRALAEVLQTFQSAGIPVLVLKGMAVAQLVYPDPGLRVMSDIDLLVSKSDAHRAQSLLAATGFRAADPGVGADAFKHHHMPAAWRQVEGVGVNIELHHNISERQPPGGQFEALRPAATPFTLEGVPAYALSYAAMLAHTYAHMVEQPFQPFRLIWIADLVSLVEGFDAQIDWSRVPPRIRRALTVMNWLTPFETECPAPSPTPERQAARLRGWPLSVTPAQNPEEYRSNMPKAFRPSRWWLHVYYGLGIGPGSEWARLGLLVWHPFHLLWWVARYRGGAQALEHAKKYISQCSRR